ncbi:E3 ubiquitin-protein ligase ZNF598 [Anopheles gambiae]|uniref:E3 ubiquitin-protein ligase ZNF598 n=1 Tax=Anopheles gambiae TaxID=7165 RepID=UPI002AC9104D|nr:E3 ubiquitin-protein ligase ZNF598 [Anopheles gambiae]XP_061497723.1 E3 ubiquitin-protein ligase ZNF598 [Anopheles gambiae]XP_061497733.1 E3 ubiquitin-protein ligase ZNF598 [Anopheles gambiae]
MVASEPEDDVQKNSPPPMENNDDNAPSKRFYRQQVWTTMKALFPQGSASSNYVNRKIPLFPAAEQTAERLAETPEFKQATNIKVNIDMAQEAVKLQVLKANKTLFVAPSQKSDYLYAKIKLPSSVEEVPLVQQRRIVKMLAGEDTYEELGIDQTEPLDMVVVGCVAVSERGQRIGKGNGYVDLEIAILVQLGVITPKTVIATTVADEQVFSELQADLFQPYDFTVDLIVTPTRVIRVEPRPEPRAIGVQWGLLSSRRLDVVRVLKKLKERLESEGKHIELKDEDTDVESFRKRRTRGSGSAGGQQQDRRRQSNRRRRSTRNSAAGEGGKSGNEQDGGNGDGGNESGEGGGPRMRRKRRYSRKPRRYSRRDSGDYGSPDGGRTGGEEGGDGQQHQRQRPHPGGKGGRLRPNNKAGAANGTNGQPAAQQKQQRPPRQPKPQLQDSVRIRVSNMFSVPFKDFKDELRTRDCYPAKISQSRNGRCLLIFPKRDDLEEQAQADELLQKLADMRISVPQKNSAEPKQIKLKCELQPKSKDFGENDATSIASAANRAARKANDAGQKLGVAGAAPPADGAEQQGEEPANVSELLQEVLAATQLAARAAKAAKAVAEKVLQESLAEADREPASSDDPDRSKKLLAQIDEVTKAGAEAHAAGLKAEAAVAAVAPPAATPDADGAETALPTKEQVPAMVSATQEVARAAAAVAYALATLFELVPPPPTRSSVAVAPVSTVVRLFRSLLPASAISSSSSTTTTTTTTTTATATTTTDTNTTATVSS